jgi:ABC-2 type transport system ATP-binding protein
MVSTAVLEITDLLKDYGDYRAVDRISFSIQKGQAVGLLGPNGAGKSTTIQMLLGITERTAGTIKYFGKDFPKHRQECLQRINFSSAYNTLQDRLSVTENLQVFAALYQVENPRQKIAGLLDYFDMNRMAKQRYKNLSAGERARVNLSKALLNDPELILMDEPTASLDPDIADKTLTLIEELRRDRGISILFTSHNMTEVERICDEVIFLDRGKIVSQGTPGNHTGRINRSTVVLRYSGKRADVEDLLKKQNLEFEHTSSHTVSVSTTSDKVIPLLEAFGKKGITVQDIDIKKTTLEDVFLDIARRKK